MLGGHCLRGQSTWQSTVALSSGESEYYAIVKAAGPGAYTGRAARGQARYASRDPLRQLSSEGLCSACWVGQAEA
eukprot:1806053-Amphidinium_carterae.1